MTTKDRDTTIVAAMGEEMGIVPPPEGPDVYAPRGNGQTARRMVSQLKEDAPELSRELATRLMDSANISADTLTEIGNMLRAVASEMREEGQQIADHLVDYDRRRETQQQFAQSIRAFINDSRMLRRV